MSVPRKIAADIAERLLNGHSAKERVQKLAPRMPGDDPLKPRIPGGNDYSMEGVAKRRDFLKSQGLAVDRLAASDLDGDPEMFAGNIESLVGFAQLPVGVIGPMRINGSNAFGDFYIPLATSEGALVASCNRGAYVISHSGGAAVLCLTEAVSRAPCFVFSSMAETCRFVEWALSRFPDFQEEVANTTSHGKLTDMRTSLIGKDVYLIFEYYTGDASGQNMVTIATNAICEYLVAGSPVKPQRWFLEGNLSGDKKATMLSFLYARGKKIVAEVKIPEQLLRKVLHVTAQEMIDYWQVSVIGGVQSGSIGVHGHYANLLAALFIACGQDAACVSEASVGLTRMDLEEDGGLYVSVALPNLIVGTIRGGTGLPSARECLEMLGCYGKDGARKFAEICAATVLAAEISIGAAFASGEFASAHQKYGRRRSTR